MSQQYIMIKFKKGKFASLRRKVAVSAINALNVEISQIPDLPKKSNIRHFEKKNQRFQQDF